MSTNTKDNVLNFLKVLDAKLNHDATIVVLGGTALTLLGSKGYSLDIDVIIVSKNNIEDFTDKYLEASEETRVEIGHPPFTDFDCSLLRIPDFFDNSKPYTEVKFEHLNIFIMGLEDIIISKFWRSLPKDREDIEKLLSWKKITKSQMSARFIQLMRPQFLEQRPVLQKKEKEFFEIFGSLLH